MDQLFTLHEVAAHLHRSSRSMREWLRAYPADIYGKPFYARIGRTMLFRAADVERIEELAREMAGRPRGAPQLASHVMPSELALKRRLDRLLADKSARGTKRPAGRAAPPRVARRRIHKPVAPGAGAGLPGCGKSD